MAGATGANAILFARGRIMARYPAAVDARHR